MELEMLRNELNIVNAENHTLRRLNEDLWEKHLNAHSLPIRTIVAERVGRNLRAATFIACGLAGIVVGQVKRVKLPRLRVDWQ